MKGYRTIIGILLALALLVSSAIPVGASEINITEEAAAGEAAAAETEAEPEKKLSETNESIATDPADHTGDDRQRQA